MPEEAPALTLGVIDDPCSLVDHNPKRQRGGFELQQLLDGCFDGSDIRFSEERPRQLSLPIVEKHCGKRAAPLRVNRRDELVIVVRAPKIRAAGDPALGEEIDRGLLLFRLVGGYGDQVEALLAHAAVQLCQ